MTYLVRRVAAAAPANQTVSKVARRLVPFLVACFFAAYLDRVNVGFAALSMNADLGFSRTGAAFRLYDVGRDDLHQDPDRVGRKFAECILEEPLRLVEALVEAERLVFCSSVGNDRVRSTILHKTFDLLATNRASVVMAAKLFETQKP